jgi:hypothetical protein
MSKSIRSSEIHFEKQKVPRFRRLDTPHISAIESLYKSFPFLSQRVEIHMPFHRAKPTFSSGCVWMWPKFDKRPVGYLVFIDGFAPCIWFPERQEGMTFRWLLPPSFCQNGPTVCLANILADESLLQIEDIVIYEGRDLWTHLAFPERWNKLADFWKTLPEAQPLLAFKPQIVKPITLEEWPAKYEPSIYWIIQPAHAGQPRWYWKDIVTPHAKVDYRAPMIVRSSNIINVLHANCSPYGNLPDIYSLTAKDGEFIGIASVSTLYLSNELKKLFANMDTNTLEPTIQKSVVEIKWNENFGKYQIVKIMPADTPVTTISFFHHGTSTSVAIE